MNNTKMTEDQIHQHHQFDLIAEQTLELNKLITTEYDSSNTEEIMKTRVCLHLNIGAYLKYSDRFIDSDTENKLLDKAKLVMENASNILKISTYTNNKQK